MKTATLYITEAGGAIQWRIRGDGIDSGRAVVTGGQAAAKSDALRWFVNNVFRGYRLLDHRGNVLCECPQEKTVNVADLVVDEAPLGQGVRWYLSYKGQTHSGSAANIPEAIAYVRSQWRDLFPHAERLTFNGEQILDEATDSHRLRQVASWLMPFGGVPSIDLAIEDLNRIADELENGR